MINIGFDLAAKEEAVKLYCSEYGLKNVIIFHPDGWSTIRIDGAEYVPYSEIIMYRTFYPLLQKIDNSYLLVFDECLRTKNRNDLTYNCAHHYGNQTKHIIVFEHFPFIDDTEDFMILLDLEKPNRYKGQKFADYLLQETIVNVIHNDIAIFKEETIPTEKQIAAYEKKKQELFDGLGMKDPDTIPNALQLFASKYKIIDEDKTYIARNQRYKQLNVLSFTQAVSGWSRLYAIDLPLSQKTFNDFVKLSGVKEIVFCHSGLKVDDYFYNRYKKWEREVQAFNAKAGIHTQERTGCSNRENQ